MAKSSSDKPVATSPKVSDRVAKTTCYMCACRCGIDVHIRDDKIRYIAGNRDHPVNRGVLCAKGSAGIMQHNSPARLHQPLKRIGERGEGKFAPISWEEALQTASAWLRDVRTRDPGKLAFFTGRDQSQSFTGWWAKQFGTPNFAAHGGFCSVNMATAGLYTIGGSFWEFGEVDWERTRLFLMFGVAEDHDSNPIKIGLGRLKARGGKFISLNPVRTGYSAIADEWIGVRPGTDGILLGGLIHQLLRTERVDWQYLRHASNATWLVHDCEGMAHHGLFVRDAEENPCIWDAARDCLVPFSDADATPALGGRYTLPDGGEAVPVFQLLAHRFLQPEWSAQAVASKTGLTRERIKTLAEEIARAAFDDPEIIAQQWTDWRGVTHDTITARAVSLHAMRGISAHSNGFHTCRMLHLLQTLLGAIDTPGSFLYKPPFPRRCPPGPKPAGQHREANTELSGMPLGFPTGPEDLLVDKHDQPMRIDKAYSWDYPLAAHGLMHMVLHNAWKGDPYPVEVLFMYMANMGWNSAMNLRDTHHYLTDRNADGAYRIPKLIYSDAYHSEMVAYADLVLPDTTYLERWDCISLLDRPISSAHGPADSIRHPVLTPNRDVRPFQDVLVDLGARLHLPGFVTADGTPAYPKGYADYMVNHQRAPGIGPLAGWRGETEDMHGRGPVNPKQLQRYIENGGFWQAHFAPEQQYLRNINKAYLEHALAMGWIADTQPIIVQIYSEVLQKFRLAGQGYGPRPAPEAARARLCRYFDPLPMWHAPLDAIDDNQFPLSAITQRPMHMYHSWGSQNAWLRQITHDNHLYIAAETARKYGLVDNDWVWVISRHHRIRAPIRIQLGVNPHTVWTWNAVGKRRGSWGLSADAPEAWRGFLLNHIIDDLLPAQPDGVRYANADPVTGQAAWYDLTVRLEKCAPHDPAHIWPLPDAMAALPPPSAPDAARHVLRYGGEWKPQTPPHANRLAGDIYEFIGGANSVPEPKQSRNGHKKQGKGSI